MLNHNNNKFGRICFWPECGRYSVLKTFSFRFSLGELKKWFFDVSPEWNFLKFKNLKVILRPTSKDQDHFLRNIYFFFWKKEFEFYPRLLTKVRSGLNLRFWRIFGSIIFWKDISTEKIKIFRSQKLIVLKFDYLRFTILSVC